MCAQTLRLTPLSSKRLREEIETDNWVDPCVAALREVQHRKKRHTAIAWEQKRIADDRWTKEAVQGSMAAAHKHLKSSEISALLPSDIPATATPDLTETAQSTTDRRVQQWSRRWQRDVDQLDAIAESMRDFHTAAVNEERQAITPDVLRSAMQDMTARFALGLGAWSPALLAALSRQGLEAFTDLINAVEMKVAWYKQLLLVWYVLLTKPSGGIQPGKERPIGLLPMLVRVWERIRRPGLASWCQQPWPRVRP